MCGIILLASNNDNVFCVVVLEPVCQQKSFERQQCGNLESPFVTPDQCLKANCCYDDMFMDEPEIKWYGAQGKVWCYTKNSGKKMHIHS